VLRRQGHKVYYAENTLWHCLFGLLFWDQLFETGQLHSGFDRMPQCLKNKTFMRSFGQQIEGKLAAVQSLTALPPILRTVAAHWAEPNGIFAWDHVDMDALRALLHACPGGVAAMLRLMGEDYQAMRDGFPDLMTEKGEAVSFVEVKAEGDVIRRNQLTRLRQLNNAGIRAEIARVDFRFDPEQDYVVVDIETTGSWSNGDRITEIGAVKVRNHEVVAEWHSLINPQRSIPANITRLAALQGDKSKAGSILRVPAADVETLVAEALRKLSPDRAALQTDIRDLIDRVVIGRATIRIQLSEVAEGTDSARVLTLPWTRPSPYRKREIIQGANDASACAQAPGVHR
jgi:DNA polymerase III subunit epsilon